MHDFMIDTTTTTRFNSPHLRAITLDANIYCGLDPRRLQCVRSKCNGKTSAYVISWSRILSDQANKLNPLYNKSRNMDTNLIYPGLEDGIYEQDLFGCPRHYISS